jgi:hypothetical protein
MRLLLLIGVFLAFTLPAFGLGAPPSLVLMKDGAEPLRVSSLPGQDFAGLASHSPGLTPSTSATCFTNPKTITTAALVTLDYFRAHPESDVFYLWPSDNGCDCGKCVKLDKGAESRSESYGRMVRQVAVRASRVYPGKKVGYVASGPTLSPPTVRLPENVSVLIVHTAASDLDAERKLLRKWRLVSSDLTVFDADQETGQEPSEAAYRAARSMEYVRSVRDEGVIGWVGATGTDELSAPYNYAILHLLRDGSRSLADILDGYFSLAFSATAPQIKRFYQSNEEYWRRQARAATRPRDYSSDSPILETAWNSLMEARRTALGPERDRVRAMAREFAPTYFPVKAYMLAASAEARPLNGEDDLARAVADIQNALHAAGAADRARNEAGVSTESAWEDGLREKLQTSVRRVKEWAANNLSQEDAEMAITDLTYRLQSEPWAEKAKLIEIVNRG